MSIPDEITPGPVEEEIRLRLMRALDRAIRGEPEPVVPRRIIREPGRAPDAAGRPITFNAAMVRALLAGNKTQTRRPIRPVPAGETVHRGQPWPTDAAGKPVACTLASYGDLLWVREPWNHGTADDNPRRAKYVYEADIGPAAAKHRKWRPGRFMPRQASRLTLRVTGVLPQRLQMLFPADASAEGMPPGLFDDEPEAAITWFQRLWDSIYADTEFAWHRNPWVWVVRFRAVDPERDRPG